MCVLPNAGGRPAEDFIGVSRGPKRSAADGGKKPAGEGGHGFGAHAHVCGVAADWPVEIRGLHAVFRIDRCRCCRSPSRSFMVPAAAGDHASLSTPESWSAWRQASVDTTCMGLTSIHRPWSWRSRSVIDPHETTPTRVYCLAFN